MTSSVDPIGTDPLFILKKTHGDEDSPDFGCSVMN